MALELFSGNSGRDRFPIVRRGYDPEVVDAFLDALEGWDPHNATDGELSVSEVMNKMFPVVKRGYDRARVHRYMYVVAGGQLEQLAA